MNTQQQQKDATTLVEESWAAAAGVDGVVDTFYRRLFEIRPDFKTTLFGRTNMKAQSKMLASAIDTAVKHLRQPDVLGPVLADLGVRHCRYGVRPEDYGPVADALLWTLQHYLGDKFTPQTKEAWVGVLTAIAAGMSAPCETPEGKRLLAEYEAKYPVPKRSGSGSCCGCRCSTTAACAVGGVALAVAAALLYFRRRK